MFTDHEYAAIGWTLFALGWLILAAGIAEQVIQHMREERGQKPRPLPGALGASMADEQERARREAEMVARLEAVFPPWDEDIEQWEAEMGRAES